MLTSGCVDVCGIFSHVDGCVGVNVVLGRGSSKHGEQLCPLHSAGGHFTQSNWISRTVDPITSVVTRH